MQQERKQFNHYQQEDSEEFEETEEELEMPKTLSKPMAIPQVNISYSDTILSCILHDKEEEIACSPLIYTKIKHWDF